MEYVIILVLIGLGYLISKSQEKHSLKQRQLQIDVVRYQQQSLTDFLNQWLIHEEPLHTKDSGYPLDWKIRRQFVLLRDKFTCANCQKALPYRFVGSDNWQQELYGHDGNLTHRNKVGYICPSAQVHHIQRIRDGGDHELANLELLCETCHTEQPGHKLLHRSVHLEHYYKAYRGNNKLKTARTEHICDICAKTIQPGEEYFGGYYKQKNSGRFGIKLESKVCLDCYKHYENRYKSVE